MRQSILTGLVITAAALCGVVLFVILLTVLNRNSAVSTNAVSVAPVVHHGNSNPSIVMNRLAQSVPPVPATKPVALANELSPPGTITGRQHLPRLLPGVQAPMTITSIAHVRAHSSWITALTIDQHGRWWIGTEGQGVSCYDPNAKRGDRWQRYNNQQFAPNNVYALACDGMGRIWAGSLRHGVCVYNGKKWRDYDLIAGQGYGRSGGAGYDRLNPETPGAHRQTVNNADAYTTSRAGPLGQRVFGIAISPIDGDVWIATAKGLTRYRVHQNIWQYYTRANGLPANQVSCLAFAPDGTLFVGLQCNGLAVASPKHDYKTWTYIRGPVTPPSAAWGAGLPDDRVNALAVVPRGFQHGRPAYRVYAGTESGLAYGEDNGRLWQFIRGRNCILKVKGQWHVPPHWKAPSSAVRSHLLLTDYVTALATDCDGNIWVGHRTGGFEILNQHNERIFPGADSAANSIAHDFIASMAALPNGGMLVGGYESGLFQVKVKLPPGAVAPFKPMPLPDVAPPLPAGARAPTTAALKRMIAAVKAGQGPALQAASLGADWRTEGDWLGHYGVAYAKLCDGGPNFQTGQDQFFGTSGYARIQQEASPHMLQSGDMRYYVARYHSQSRRTLYDPDMGQRVEGEWNDDGQDYPRFFQGPDMWLAVTIPKGLYRLSLYFHNKDGESGFNMVRDYVVQVFARGLPPALAWQTDRPLAQSRIKQFWGGMYTTFLLKGPGIFPVRLARNGSLNMAVAGMFLDPLNAPANNNGYTNTNGLPPSTYRPPTPVLNATVARSAANVLWHLLNQRNAYSKADIYRQWPDRIMAYRYAQAHGYPPVLLAQWRWKLCIWLPPDRQAFDDMMLETQAPTPPAGLK